MPSTPTDTTCVVYCRVSTDRQAKEDKGSLDAQEANGLAKAAELGLRVLYTVKDAESAWILDKRSKFQQVLHDARAGQFRWLIVDRMNRFTRSEDLSEYMAVMTELRAAGVTPIFTDREYEQSPTGQLMMTMDAWVSAMEQANRRKQSLTGKRHKVEHLHRPNPGSWPRYGYVWVDDEKTRMDFDPGDSQRVVRRIWDNFLHAEHPTLSGTKKALNREGVLPPREYRGIAAAKNTPSAGSRWTIETIRNILRNPIYWGGNADGLVPAFVESKYSNQTLIPAYAPAYVTRDEAARVHARLETNKAYAARNRKHDFGTLLYGGFVRCAYCGWKLVTTYHRPRVDGTRLAVYRCQHSRSHGTNDCKGVQISAETLDLAVLDALDQQIHKGDFLRRIFDAWEADSELAMATVRAAEATLKETHQQVQNAAARLATYAPGDPLAAPLENHARMLAATLPGLQDRVARAQAAVQAARGNPELRHQLATWFDGWLCGMWLLSRDAQRDFLASLKAHVKLWRAEDRTPRAQLVIALPSSALRLPIAPSVSSSDSPLQRDAETGEWLLNVDTEEAAQMAADARGVTFVDTAGDAAAAPTNDGDVAALMQDIVAELTAQGYGDAVAQRMAGPIVSSRPRRCHRAPADRQARVAVACVQHHPPAV